MLYISDFFVNKKEAVSNQIEALRLKENGTIFAASIFMNQRILNIEDIKNKRIILPNFVYKILLPVVCLFSKKGIHFFEEEPSEFKRFCFNISKSKLFITMYRKPFPEYIEHLKLYKNLAQIFVEMESHKEMMVKAGIADSLITVAKTPSFFPKEEPKSIDLNKQKNINLLFASWNSGTYQALYERGIIYLMDLVKYNSNLNLKIVLRDNDILLAQNLINQKGIADRVKFIDIKQPPEIRELFITTDFVIFTPQIKVTKDVPNSVLDGFKYGKPCIISEIPDFSNVVEEHELGIKVRVGELFDFSKLSEKQYADYVRNVLHESDSHTIETYLNLHDYKSYESINLQHLAYK